MKWFRNLEKWEKVVLIFAALVLCGIFSIIEIIWLSTIFLIIAVLLIVFTIRTEKLKKNKHNNPDFDEERPRTQPLIVPYQVKTYALDEIDGNNGRRSRKNIIRRMYWNDGDYEILYPRVITLSAENNKYDVFVNGEKIGAIPEKYTWEVRLIYNRIVKIDMYIEHEREPGNTLYEPVITLHYYTENSLAENPNFLYKNQGKRLSTYSSPCFLDEYIVIDIETTGLNPLTDDILEIAALHIKTGSVADSFSEFVYSDKITEKSMEINHITPARVANARKCSEVLKDFTNFISELPLIGHNICFDLSFIRTKISIDNSFDDTCALSKRYLCDGKYGIMLENCKLPTVCAALNISFVPNHRALDDCKCTFECYEKIKGILNQPEEAVSL